MVTLKSHKVYVGKPYLLLWDDPTQVLTFIKILPIKSGYRDIEDLGIVIAWSEVESLTIYDDNLYKAFQEQTPSPAAVQLPVR